MNIQALIDALAARIVAREPNADMDAIRRPQDHAALDILANFKQWRNGAELPSAYTDDLERALMLDCATWTDYARQYGVLSDCARAERFVYPRERAFTPSGDLRPIAELGNRYASYLELEAETMRQSMAEIHAAAQSVEERDAPQCRAA